MLKAILQHIQRLVRLVIKIIGELPEAGPRFSPFLRAKDALHAGSELYSKVGDDLNDKGSVSW